MNTSNLQITKIENGKNEEALFQRKKELRKYMKERRGQNENRDVKEKLLLSNFTEYILSDWDRAGTRLNLFVYLSYSSEAPTDALIEILKSAGHKVYAPRLENGEMLAVEHGEDFSLSSYGIREPIGPSFEGAIDAVITPLLATDLQGNRLGYGGGYYDRFFKKYPNAQRIGYCYDFQVLKEIPTTSLDERLEMIVTDKRFLKMDLTK